MNGVNGMSGAGSEPPRQFADLGLARHQPGTTHQLTTFDLERRSKTVPVKPGNRVTVGEVHGAGNIATLWLTFPGWFWQHWNVQAPVSQSILKTLILRIYWDGADVPAVACPVGDFFGIGLCEVAHFTSRYFGMSSGGFFCRWPMPFKEGFRIEVENRDASIATDVFMNVIYQLRADLPGDCRYFHTQFRTGDNPGPDPVGIAEWHGQGHYVGCTLSMQGEEQNYFSFLEAPEYIFVDEDWDRPRIVGTGLEDYFLGGWYFREGAFDGELHGVPLKDNINAAIAMYRIHEADAIRFHDRFRMAFINPWEPDRLKPFRFSSAAFAYLTTPEGLGEPIPARDDLLLWYRIRNSDHLSYP